MRFPAVVVAGLGLSAAVVACGSSSNSNEGSSSDSGSSGGTPTFTEVYTQVIQPNCAFCHTSGQPGGTQGMLDMSTQALAFTNLVGKAAAGQLCSGQGTRVVAGNPDSSLLFEKVSQTTPPCGSRMPLNLSPLSQSAINEIHDWIAGNAPNN
jgi:hypothetical protein